MRTWTKDQYRTARQNGTMNDPIGLDMHSAILVLAALAALASPPGAAAPFQDGSPGPSSQSSPSILIRTFTVFFDFDSSRLDDKAVETIALASETCQGDTVKIQVIGRSDATAPVIRNLDLFERRAMTVKTQLENDGIPESDISITEQSFEYSLVVARSEVREPHDRDATTDFGI